MIVASNSAAQTLTTGQSMTFDLLKQTGCSEYVADGTSQVYLKAGGVYLVDFSGNITSTEATTPIQLQISINGSPLADGVMNATPAAAGDLVNVSRATAVNTNPNCCFSIGTAYVTITNTGANPLVVAAGSSRRIGRVG